MAELSVLLLRLGLKDPLPVLSLDGIDSADTLGTEAEDELCAALAGVATRRLSEFNS